MNFWHFSQKNLAKMNIVFTDRIDLQQQKSKKKLVFKFFTIKAFHKIDLFFNRLCSVYTYKNKI